MKKTKLIFIALIVLLQSGCLTTQLTYEDQKKYRNVLVVSAHGEKFTVNHAKNYLLAIKNEIYTQELANGGFRKDFEDFIVSELEGRVPFKLTTMQEFYLKNKIGALEIFQRMNKAKNPKKLLIENGFDGILFLNDQTIVYGHPQGGIDLVFDEMGIYRQGKKAFAFSHFAFSFVDAENGKNVFWDSFLEKSEINAASFRWPTAGKPLDPEVSGVLMRLTARLTKERIGTILEKRFL